MWGALLGPFILALLGPLGPVGPIRALVPFCGIQLGPVEPFHLGPVGPRQGARLVHKWAHKGTTNTNKYKGRRHEASAIDIRRTVRAYGHLRRRVERPCKATPL